MPLIDVTELLTDPDFMTTFDVIRGVQSVDGHGMAHVVNTTYSNQSGVVYPVAGGRGLVRTPEGEQVLWDINVVTKFRLSNGGGDSQADIVAWNGSQWTVVNTDDFNEYGAGFIVAMCIKKELG